MCIVNNKPANRRNKSRVYLRLKLSNVVAAVVVVVFPDNFVEYLCCFDDDDDAEDAHVE